MVVVEDVIFTLKVMVASFESLASAGSVEDSGCFVIVTDGTKLFHSGHVEVSTNAS